jgi:glucose/arabinose dehydrogenase
MRRAQSRWAFIVLILTLLAGCSTAPTTPATATAADATLAPATQPPNTPSPLPAKDTPTAKPAQATNTPAAAQSTQSFPDPSAFTWQTMASGLVRPDAVTGDGHGRLLVIEQRGVIRVVENNQVRAEPYLDISTLAGSEGNEQGLLGIALSPQYASNGYFYVNYTDTNGNTVIARFSADPDKATARTDSQKILLRIKQPYPNHNGGSMVFGSDGYLYMGLGDGGSGGDPQGNGQNLNTYLGKLLRIDVSQGDPYTVPADNPFLKQGKPEIWAYGLRNPWRFSFDRATGDLYIGDVGQDTWEEIDFLPAGSKGGVNFGWNYMEATHPYKGQPPAGLAQVDPIFEYKHPTGCSVTGGYVYRGSALPSLQGIYLYADYCTGKISGLLRDAQGNWQYKQLFETGTFISSFGEDDQGELYITSHQNGVVMKLVKK